MRIATVCSGIGSPELVLRELGVEHTISFACEIDKYARQTYLANFNPDQMLTDMTKEDWDKPEHYADIFVGGIPCQAFSLAGKRLGELDPRGLLFYDFYRYVKNQQPKIFIIENVKGLLSDNNGTTFSNWRQLLGQSMNTHLNMFNHPDSLLYNLHFKVLNTKDFGIPQNRERVFIVGIRNDLPNSFRFPPGEVLKLRLKHVLEPEVDEKYYLSDKMLQGFDSKGGDFGERFNPKTGDDLANCLTSRYHKMAITDNYLMEPKIIKSGQITMDGMHESSGRVYSPEGLAPTVTAKQGGGHEPYILEQTCVAMRGRDKDGKWVQQLEERTDGLTNTLTGVEKDNLIKEVLVSRERRTEEAKAERRQTGSNGFRGKELVFEPNDVMNCIQTSPTNDNLIIVKEATKKGYAIAKEGDSINLSQPKSETRRGRVGDQIANTLDTACNQAVVVKGVIGELMDSFRIRRLTPLECFRLQGFPDDFVKPCSDSQLYKQAGNTISTTVLKALFLRLLPILTENNN